MAVVQADTVLTTTYPMLFIGILFSVFAIFTITIITAITNERRRKKQALLCKKQGNRNKSAAVYIDTTSGSSASVPFLVDPNEFVVLPGNEDDDDSIYSTDIEKESVICTFGTDTLEGLLKQENMFGKSISHSSLDSISLFGDDEEQTKGTLIRENSENGKEMKDGSMCWDCVSDITSDKGSNAGDGNSRCSSGSLGSSEKVQDQPVCINVFEAEKKDKLNLSSCKEFVLVHPIQLPVELEPFESDGESTIENGSVSNPSLQEIIVEKQKCKIVQVNDTSASRAIISAARTHVNAGIAFLLFIVLLLFELLEKVARIPHRTSSAV